MLCIRVLTVFLGPGPGHRAVITCSFAIQVVSSDRHLVALVFQKTSSFVGIKLTVWNLYWKCMTWLSLWFKLHGKPNVVTVPCFLGRNLWDANKCQLLSKDWKLIKTSTFFQQTLKSPKSQASSGFGRWNRLALSAEVAREPFFSFLQSVTECINHGLF